MVFSRDALWLYERMKLRFEQDKSEVLHAAKMQHFCPTRL